MRRHTGEKAYHCICCVTSNVLDFSDKTLDNKNGREELVKVPL